MALPGSGCAVGSCQRPQLLILTTSGAQVQGEGRAGQATAPNLFLEVTKGAGYGNKVRIAAGLHDVMNTV